MDDDDWVYLYTGSDEECYVTFDSNGGLSSALDHGFSSSTITPKIALELAGVLRSWANAQNPLADRPSLVERLISGDESAEWLFKYPSSLNLDTQFLVQIIWEHVQKRGEFDWETRDNLGRILMGKING